MTPWFLGMDVGGTSTRAVLIDADGRVGGHGKVGSANPHNVGIDVARARLAEAVSLAWRSMGETCQPAQHAFLGCAGVKSREEISQMCAVAESERFALPGEVTAANDLHNALSGGLSGRPGIALIAGTGTNCLGRDADGETFMCGGWGWLLDDEGGGFGLTLAAVKAVARASDGRSRSSSLSPAVLEFFGASEPDELLSYFYCQKWTPGSVAEFAPVVMRHAEEGDLVAKGILVAGAQALAELVGGVVKELSFPEGPEVVLLGGCGCSGSPYQDIVEGLLRESCPKVRLVRPEGSPLKGAAFNALACAGIDVKRITNPKRFEL